MTDGRSLLHFLTHSEERQQLIDALGEGPATPADLTAELSVTRRTVQRTLRAFEDRGLVEGEHGRYTLTCTGELVQETLQEALADVDAVLAHRAVYDRLQQDAPRPDPEWLADATVATTEDDDRPRSVECWYVRRIRALDGTSLQAVLPIVTPATGDILQHILEGDTTAIEVVVGPECQDALRREVASVDPPDPTAIDAFRTAETPPLAYVVVDDDAFVLSYDDDGHLEMAAQSTTRRFRDWVLEQIHAHRETADRVPLDREPNPTTT